MATVAHHILSTYNPEEDRERLEVETGQYDVEAHDQADPWLTEKPFGSSKRVTHPPMFVAATIDYNEWGSSSSLLDEKARHAGGRREEGIESIGGWYKSLARKTPIGTSRSVTPTNQSPTPPLARDAREKERKLIKRDRNNWFISRALEASSSSTNNHPGSSSSQSPTGSGTTSPRAPTPTLADILARDPPPLPTEQKYTPPVWIAIGPSNKGFEMLQKSGWEEGEALGRASRNRAGLGYSVKGKEREVGRNGGVDDDGEVEEVKAVKQEVVDATVDENEIIDLTGLDDESPELGDTFTNRSVQSIRTATLSISNNDIDHSPHALLTPLPTILKSDKLGIGLKAKTIGTGIHREPVKRVTHSQAALAAHIRASEEQRRVKKLMGRGRRGFERVRKREEDGRKRLLAYLNT
ncbi:uncharacterized protein FOMMEDRAFT_171097 [Fomitiporia mediterranea MF3/22]|uniref:uncharacterized protein n=1 Tax=Fomitiporia mediterranea (strain MF3/22) TaxID=694068 RepID=UPI0004408049|nr:uncharacterized protein FOMMEDRAFT_171097 [Fomitiporia mediterranea MF3/22]EJC98485.1 hypothetical protein FOMMEDRAFT_171097 [Fomitiporia mediterranea MF3/22]